MNITKTFLTLGLASMVMQSMAAPVGEAAGVEARKNPLLVQSKLPYGAPDFKNIRTSDYLPALQAGIAEQRRNVEAIVNNAETPTFQNTIVAFEESGALLERVANVFFGLISADKTPEIAETEKAAIPLLTALENELMFNK